GGAAPAVFVSYARADSAIVIPVCEAVKAQGPSLWLDKEGIGAGENWAGEIVRAIKAVRGVAVMCSKAAFESDHVKREIYLADRYKKHLLPVFIEDATPPEDFEYFFAGVQHLKLHETPEAERGPAMAKALASV
ncbi:MAG: toll/interleukin-1 receptor domain-containing protein, partial [Hydrogenophilaceae bacterium]|nr:toll/interleukin-1 receptor domain-containing protein [Hydrogenophilaceae bacterium]